MYDQDLALSPTVAVERARYASVGWWIHKRTAECPLSVVVLDTT
jgi:hypothetical protein